MLEDGRCLRGNDALAFFATAERVDRDPHPMHCAHCGVELGPVVWLDGDRMLCREGCDGVYLATTFILRSEDDIAWDRYIHDALD